jgi:L-alanine-DL-glutamate epimerase-like enolase superfamily enzyme
MTAIDLLEVAAYEIPTDAPEADGTLAWDSTTIVVVHASAGSACGVGYTYADVSTAVLIERTLAPLICGRRADRPRDAWLQMVRQTRNLGRPGIVSMAISAVDAALWDLHARLLDVPLAGLLGAVRDHVPVYGSGGFTSYNDDQLAEQLGGWVKAGIPRVKMKVGSNPADDPRRVAVARDAIGSGCELFVDANGAYSRKQAISLAERFADESRVAWFEEPVSSDDLDGLRLVRDRAPAPIEVAAGEYGYDTPYFRRMLNAGAVDVLQADMTRCAGITGLMQVDALCHSNSMALSLHCGPAVHTHPGCALLTLRHLVYFHDHVRIEHELFDGLPELRDGALWPDESRSGNGLHFRTSAAEQFRV